jgi:hypothetical protein
MQLQVIAGVDDDRKFEPRRALTGAYGRRQRQAVTELGSAESAGQDCDRGCAAER